MDKQTIVDALIEQVDTEIEKAKNAFESTRDHAIEDDLKSESKWDTRSIEANYLASGHKKRVEELKLEKQMLEEIEVRKFEADEDVAIGAVVKLEHNGKLRSYFISPTAGGTILDIDGPILVLSVFSPIGSEVLGLNVGDEFELETPKGNRLYFIKELF
jgi:transcription elongation GreA/GreB family factor